MTRCTLMLSLCTLTWCMAGQAIRKSQVPETVMAAFEKAQKDAEDVKWEKEGDHYEAEFRQEYAQHTVIISAGGQILATEVEIRTQELPMAAREYLAEHYQGTPVVDAARITAADGTVTYEAGMNQKDLIFDKDGKFLNEEADGIKEGDE